MNRPPSKNAARKPATCSPDCSPSKGERGYALLMAMFVVATMLLIAAMATPNLLTQGRREKEQELVWRGGQYTRAIRLYYKKTGHYPQTIEELAKGDAAGVHYLRKSYKDPMSPGSAESNWRVIYVSASGQLTGSVHYHTLQEMAAAMGGSQFVGVGTGQANASGIAQVFGAQSDQTGAQSGVAAQRGGNPTGSQSASGFGGGQGLQSGFGSSTQPVSAGKLEAVDGPVMGAMAIGVASKVKKPSLRVYQGGQTYFDWEFIFNPLMTAGGVAQPTTPGVAGTPGAPGTSPADASAPQPGNVPNPPGNAPVNGTGNVPGGVPLDGGRAVPGRPGPGMGAPNQQPNQPQNPAGNPPDANGNPAGPGATDNPRSPN